MNIFYGLYPYGLYYLKQHFMNFPGKKKKEKDNELPFQFLYKYVISQQALIIYCVRIAIELDLFVCSVCV